MAKAKEKSDNNIGCSQFGEEWVEYNGKNREKNHKALEK